MLTSDPGVRRALFLFTIADSAGREGATKTRVLAELALEECLAELNPQQQSEYVTIVETPPSSDLLREWRRLEDN